MSQACIRVNKLSKRFPVYLENKTALNTFMQIFGKKRSFEYIWILKDVSFELMAGEKLAIIGRNGSGKTTLIRILCGLYKQTSGQVEMNSKPSILFRFWAGLNSELSVIDNIYLFGAFHGMNRNFLKKRIDGILQDTGLWPLRFTQLKFLSSGQVQWLAINVFFQGQRELQIFDETLMFLDKSTVQKCLSFFDKIKYDQNKTAIIVSHDTDFINKYCTKAIWIDQGIVRMSGNVKEVVDEYEKSIFSPTGA
jgi:ABC-type polysaccharide/polyol phosphate transport system ATPase subunit